MVLGFGNPSCDSSSPVRIKQQVVELDFLYPLQLLMRQICRLHQCHDMPCRNHGSTVRRRRLLVSSCPCAASTSNVWARVVAGFFQLIKRVKFAIDIVSVPMNNGRSFHSYMLNHQGVSFQSSLWNPFDESEAVIQSWTLPLVSWRLDLP